MKLRRGTGVSATGGRRGGGVSRHRLTFFQPKGIVVPLVLFLALIVVALATPAAAAPLDLPGAVRFALSHDPNLLAKDANVANLESQFVKAHAAEFPAISGQLSNQLAKSANTQGQFAQFGISQQSNFSQNTAQVTSQWQIYNGSLNQVLAQEDWRDVEAARFDLQRARDVVAANVANAFFALAGKLETVSVDEGNRIYQQRLLDAARANERVGRTAGVDTLRAQVAATRAEADLVTARADYANSREALANEIGAPLDIDFALPAVIPQPSLPTTPLAALVGVAEAARPDVASARANVAAAVLANGAIDTDLRPQITLTGAFGNQTSPTEFVSEQQQIDAENIQAQQQYQLLREIAPHVIIPPPVFLPPVTRGTPGFWQIGATASLTIPLIDYGTRRAAHRAARTQIDAQEAALSNARSAVDLDVRHALRDAQTNSTNLGLALQSVALARESARIAQLQYANGLISFTDANATEQTALQAQSDLVTARVAYVVSLVRLRIALGTSDPVAAVEFH